MRESPRKGRIQRIIIDKSIIAVTYFLISRKWAMNFSILSKGQTFEIVLGQIFDGKGPLILF